ncbi:hypothetical protein PFLmoz3_03620 [Pseudomonas fluorescens]|uniref:Uncharacterized protein n=1 Tax=Pseudomonas fluorescens TaxID=294 RepID=A0A109LFL6_PSEFL|nr:hypothetical protein PFLmoz3_03620 [Pseudomonas fluorescens]
MNLSLAGQLTVLPSPSAVLNSGLMVARCLVKTAVVPLESARTTTVIGVSPSFRSGLAATICGSFHLVILPRKILE